MPTKQIQVVHANDVPEGQVKVIHKKVIKRRVPKDPNNNANAQGTLPGASSEQDRNFMVTTHNVDPSTTMHTKVINGKEVQVTRMTTMKTVRKHRVSQSKLTNWVAVKETMRLSNKDNKEQATHGREAVLLTTEKPLTQIWNRLNRIIPQILFAFNLILAILDIAREPNYLGFKVTALVFSLAENVLLALTWCFKKIPKYTNANSLEQLVMDKKLQYLENVIQELLMYPAILLTLFGVVVGKAYSVQDAFSELELVLLAFDILLLIYIYGIRIYMARKLTKHLYAQIGHIENTFCHVSNRLFVALFLNSCMFGMLLGMLALQIHSENDTTEDYSVSTWTVFLIIFILTLPIKSLCLFCIVNYYWLLEMLVLINLKAGSNTEDLLKTVNEDYAPMAEAILYFSLENTDATEERLEELQKTTLSQKFLYAVREWWVCLLLLIWGVMATLSAVAFNASFYSSGQFLRYGSLLVIVVCNYQIAAVFIAMLVYLIALFISWLSHVCCIPAEGDIDT